MKIDINKDAAAKRIIIESLKITDPHFKFNEDGTLDVSFIVGGVELDFNIFADHICEIMTRTAETRAKKMLINRCYSVVQCLEELAERIEDQNNMFLYDYEHPHDHKRFSCPYCGRTVRVKNGRAECDCGWCAADAKLDEILSEDTE
ncbi:MAG: hypothetical protein J6S14_15660 [Clostridia bacterium]|nr:hypothetical protein [Clostridia bacterium]